MASLAERADKRLLHQLAARLITTSLREPRPTPVFPPGCEGASSAVVAVPPADSAPQVHSWLRARATLLEAGDDESAVGAGELSNGYKPWVLQSPQRVYRKQKHRQAIDYEGL